jgi:hypothetical protein
MAEGTRREFPGLRFRRPTTPYAHSSDRKANTDASLKEKEVLEERVEGLLTALEDIHGLLDRFVEEARGQIASTDASHPSVTFLKAWSKKFKNAMPANGTDSCTDLPT